MIEKTMKKQLGPLEMEFGLPKSQCAIWDVFYMISTNPNRAQLGRLFAALVGICVKNHKSHPKYSLSDCDLMAYGGKVQEWLQINDVSPIDVLNVGTSLFEMLSNHIATNKAVENAENFTSARPEV